MEPLFEDLILNEMPDVGSFRLNAFKQRNLPYDEQDHHLQDKAENDLTAYVRFSFHRPKDRFFSHRNFRFS